jgi:CheY-like chemotaxis protein
MNLAFIIIDDSELDCFVAKKIIEQYSKSTKVTAYLDASIALRKIRENANLYPDETTIILLDFRLPVMNGFEFMDEFEKLPYSIQNKYIIYGLSSTVNRNDISRMCNFKNVIKVLGKPLTILNFSHLISEVQSMELG